MLWRKEAENRLEISPDFHSDKTSTVFQWRISSLQSPAVALYLVSTLGQLIKLVLRLTVVVGSSF